MKIAIDYDKTYTADKKLWDAFVKSAKKSRHAVRFVTSRSVTGDNRSLINDAKKLGIRVIYTAGTAKEKHCKEVGWKPDIWIDDQPESILKDSNDFSYCVV